MGLTVLGKFLRKLRIDNGELMKDMADKLSLSISMLSSIETGKREFNEDRYFDFIVKAYNLDEKEKREFSKAIQDSQKEVNFNLLNKKDEQRDLVFALARTIDNLSTQDIDDINSIIKKECK